MASDPICPLPPGDRSIREQDEELEVIYRAHASALRGRLLAMTRDPAVADDLVSEAFIRLAVQIRADRTPDDPAAWLYRVGANLVVSRARRASVATRALPGLVRREAARSPEDEVLDRERDLLLHDVLGSLADADREIVVLAARGYRPEEIAGIIGRSGPATRTRLCRARGRLRSRLEVAGMTA
jgi:RNA polymerase sigma-70 factor (ECF subfamily)